MPITPTTTNVDLVINRVPSLDILKQMESAGQLQPNQLYTIPSEIGDGLVALQTKVLWTNPNPTQTFVAQSIDISNLSDYDYLIIPSKMVAGGTGSQVYQNTALTNVKVGAGCTLRSNLYDTNSRNRNIIINENNVITFSDAYIEYGDFKQIDNNHCIPLEIIGIKLIESPTQITNKYSTEETVVGEWIDGKKIYRKVLEYNMNTTSASIDLSSYNIDTMISQTGYNIQTSGNVTNIPVYVETNDYACTFYRSTTTKVLELRCGSTTYGLFKIILEYTKTTE